MSHSAFRGPHKVNFSTPRLGHNLNKRLAPSKYEIINEFRRSYIPSDHDVVVVHYSFFQKFWIFLKYVLSCLFLKK